MERDEAAIEAVIAQLPSVIQGVANLQRDIQIAAELLTERVFNDGGKVICYPLHAWTRRVGRHSQEWYAGYTQVARMYCRVTAERNCRGRGESGRLRVVALRYVFEVLYGTDKMEQGKFSTFAYKPRYNDASPIDIPPINMTYEEYIDLWKL